MSGTSFVGRIQQAESGGRRFGKDGKILEGPWTRYGTAKGEMQVLDGTSRDPGFGVVPARDGSPEERARVGVDYANAMLRQFGGDEALAAAAYNHGPGNVQKLVAKHGASWASYLPKETKDYVAKVGGGNSPPVMVAAPAALPTGAALQVAAPLPAGIPPEMLVQAQSAPLVQAPADAGPDAWQAFLQSMPQTRQPVNVADIDYSNPQPAMQVPRFQYQPLENRKPNFEAFSSWKGRVA